MYLLNRFRIYAFILGALAIAVSAHTQIIDSVSLSIERRGHSATLLKDGRVLIVGGENTAGLVGQPEIFDPSSNTFLVLAASSERTDHTATLLADGRVLIAGGRDGLGALASTAIFNPADNSFSAGPSLSRARAGHTATTLGDGRILFVGGDAAGSAEILDLTQQLATPVGSLAEPRVLHGAGLLQDGRVLIVGGVDPADNAQVLDSAEIFDPQTGQFSSATTTMGIARALPVVKILPDGKLQIIGGDAEFSMEMFNPETTAFNARAHLPPTSDLLSATLSTQTRAALISTLIQNNAAVQQALSDPQLNDLLDRADHTITEIPQSSQALIAGGVNSAQEVLASSVLVQSSPATVTTDKFDYPPGHTVTIAGAGWQPNESVQMILHEEPETHPDVTVTSNADDGGNFSNTDFAPAPADLGRTFTVTAIGQTSGRTAQTAFSDALDSDDDFRITIITGNGVACGGATACLNPIHIGGPAVQDFSTAQVEINWGDGTIENSNFTLGPPVSDDFNGSWSGDHTYATGGSKTITAQIYHGTPRVNDLLRSVTITVNKPDPTVTTEIHDGTHATATSVAVGTTVHDKATVSGTVGTPTGTVTFNWFTNGTCTGPPAQTSSGFTLASGAVDGTTFTQTTNTSGSYAFQATYNGDSRYNSKSGPCEVLTVNKVDPGSFTTDIHNSSHNIVTSVDAGTTVHDKATLTANGALPVPTGTVTFSWFLNGTCTGTPVQTSGTFTLVSGTVDGTTFTQTPNTSGSFAFQATYNGDGTYNSKVGPCEVLTVNKVNVGSFTTDIHSTAHGVVTSVDAGTTVHDKATLTANGALPLPSGTVTFSWFTNGTCTGSPAQTSSAFTLASGAVDGTTFTQTPNVSGSFAFQASYSGDGTYNTVTASCELLTVNKIEATVTSDIHNGAHATVTLVAAGTTVHDSVSVSGSVGTPSGTVTFSWFTNGTCTGTPAQTSSGFTLAGGAVDGTTFTQTPNVSGSFAFQATYNGDGTYNSKVGPCEVLTVGKVTVGSFTTEIHNASHSAVTSVAAGTTVHDKATLTANGSLPLPTGSVTFNWFTNGTCTGTPTQTSDIFALTIGAVDGTTFTQTPNTSGSFSFQASYGGDGTYNSATATCELLTVGKIDPTAVTTAIHNAAHATVTSVAAGTTVHDSAAVSGSLATPTGTVTFKWFENGTCSGTPAQTSGVFTLASGAVDGTTLTQTPIDASKTYSFLASYSGDNTYNAKDAACEILTLSKIDPAVATDIHDAAHNVVTSVAAGTTVHDKATVTGTVGTPTGSVTFSWFTNGTCAGSPSQTSGPLALAGGIVDATTFAQTPGASGSFAFQASYGGDNTYNAKVGPCEALSVAKVEASVATDIHDASHNVVTSVAAGTPVHDKATITGGVGIPTGTVTFSWFTNGTCSGTASQTSSALALSSGSVDATTFVQTPAVSGSFAFQASYSGDGTYNAKLGPCEPLSVNKIDPTVTTDIHDASHAVIIAALSGTSVHDSATVSGSLATPTGTVTFKWFSNGTCSGTALATSSALALSGGTVDASSFAQIPDFHVSSTYSFQATYNGDAVYNPKTGPCESLPITLRTTGITTSLSGGGQTGTSITIIAGSSATDSATLNGATANAGGTVTYTVFSDGTCTTVFASGGTKTVTNGVAPASNAINFTQTGNYFWKVDYSGDISNDASTSGCSEQVTVLPHTITLAFVGGGFVPKITAPLPKDYKSPGVEVDISFTDSLRDGVRVDVTARAKNIANSCQKPLTPSLETLKQFSVPVSQGNLDTVQLAFKLYEVTATAMNTAKKAKCQSLTLELTQFTAVGVDAQGIQSNTLSLLGEGGVLDIIIPVGKKKTPQTLSERRTAALEEAEFQALPAGARRPPPDRR